jgi:hypothetical protein
MQLHSPPVWGAAGECLPSTTGDSRQHHHDIPSSGAFSNYCSFLSDGPTIRLSITSSNPADLLNSTIMGPEQRPMMYVITDPQMPGYTIFKNARGQSIALVEWQTHPLVAVHGAIKKRIKDWMRLSEDKS